MATVERPKQQTLDAALQIARAFADSSLGPCWLTYDEEGDVLNISLERPEDATDSLYDHDRGVLLSYRDDRLVGIAVFEASKREAGGEVLGVVRKTTARQRRSPAFSQSGKKGKVPGPA